MIAQVIELSARHRVWALIITLALAVAGWFSMQRIPIDAIPDLSETQVILCARWDRDPTQLETQVTAPIVNALSGAPRIKTVRAVTDFGSSYVYAIFEDGTDLFWARTRAQEALNSVLPTLPPGVTTSIGPDASSLGWIFQYALVDRSGTHDPAELRSLQDFYLRPQLRTVRGVAEVASVGGFSKVYQVNVDPLKLQDRNLSINDVSNALRDTNTDTGARLLELGDVEAMVRGSGRAHTVQDLAGTALSASTAGSPVLVSDVAQVILGPDLRRGAADLDGRGETVSGTIIIRDGESVPDVIAGVKARLDEVRPGLPPGVEILSVYDRSLLIEQAVRHVRLTLLEVILTVCLVILIFLRHLPSAAIPIATLPVALLISFIPFHTMGITANIMSLAGLTMAVGALVDASIIVVEQSHLRLQQWTARGCPGSHIDVIVEAIKETAEPAFFALLIIAVAFLPVLTLPGDEGKLFRPLAFTKSLAMLVGALLAITLDPALRVIVTRLHTAHQTSRFSRCFLIAPAAPSRFARGLLVRYEHAVRWSIQYRLPLLAVTLALGILSCFLAMHLGTELMPSMEEGVLLYMPSTPPGYSLTESKALLERIDALLAEQPEVSHVLGKVGRSTSVTDPAPLTMLEVVITLKPRKDWPAPADRHFFSRAADPVTALTERLDHLLQIPGVNNAWTMPVRGRIDMLSTGMRTPLGVKIMGSDPEQVARVSEQAAKILTEVPGAGRVYPERTTQGSYVDVNWNRSSLASYGISIAQAQAAFSNAVGGQDVTTIVQGVERYPVNVRYMRDFRSDLPALRKVLIPTSVAGRQVPLGSLATIERRSGPAMIRDEQGLITGYVYLDLAGQDIAGFMKQGKHALATNLHLPLGYSLRWDGQFENIALSSRRLMLIVPLTLGLVFLLLRLATRSWVRAAIVLLAVPFSTIGAFLLLAALKYKLSVAVWVGLIALIGIDAETGIFMLLYLDLSHREFLRAGLLRSRSDLVEAIIEGSARRVRPKLMTVSAMLAGLLPILWASGPGAQIMRHIAVPVIGGIVTSFLLELLVYPALFYMLHAGPYKSSQDANVSAHAAVLLER